MKITVGITGASGAILGVKVLQILRELDHEVHLIISKWGAKNIFLETGLSLDDVQKLATKSYDIDNLGAAVSSGSFKMDGMVVVPCSMKTLSAIATGFSINLIARAADVSIKERRNLVLVTRETPLSPIHLTNMLKLSQAGVKIMPPVPVFYTKAQTVDDVVNRIAGRIVDELGVDNPYVERWQ